MPLTQQNLMRSFLWTCFRIVVWADTEVARDFHLKFKEPSLQHSLCDRFEWPRSLQTHFPPVELRNVSALAALGRRAKAVIPKADRNAARREEVLLLLLIGSLVLLVQLLL